MTSSTVKILGVILVSCLAACSHNTEFKKASPAVTAATNMQLAIEYMKLGKLAAAREFMERALSEDPGNPDVCPVGDLHKIFSSKDTIAKVNEGCRSAGIGCIECKGWAADALVKLLNPMQERRRKFEENPALAWDILEDGTNRARQAAGETMDEVRAAMGMSQERGLGKGSN